MQCVFVKPHFLFPLSRWLMQQSGKKKMDDSPPPNDLDALTHDDLVRHRTADSGYLDTSYNSDDSFSSPPQLTALFPEPDADSSLLKGIHVRVQ